MKVLALIVVLAVTALAQDQVDGVEQKIIQAMNNGDSASLVSLFNPAMRDAVPEPKIKEILAHFQQQFGKIVKTESSTRPAPGSAVYRIRFERGLADLNLVLDGGGQIAGLRIVPVTDLTAGAQKHETKLSLPFKGTWLIFWGGNTPETGGQHLQAPPQRFAFDILGVGLDGKTRQGDGSKNEDYYAFGRELLAPADGVVTEVVSGVRDNQPGSMNPYSAVGNAILIEHRAGEVSLLAHLKKDSIRVKAGDHVTRGQVLALCGNSGNSSEPHLHYHLQNSAAMQDGLGIPVHFDAVFVTKEGKKEARSEYSPVKGDIVAPE
jgi:murein DD-endopeptidase MepM/ murein hydrolase activator NlpD